MTNLKTEVEAMLSRRVAQANLRQLIPSYAISPTQIVIRGKKLLNFASNDYLGLSHHPLLKAKAIEAIEKYGVGSPSSRYVSGNCELYDQIEQQIAHLKGTQAAIVFPNGFQANLTVLQALAKLNSFFFCDELSHASILLGAQLNSRNFKRFDHNNLDQAKNMIEKSINKNNWIITESVFSMDGDLSPINSLVNITKTNNNFLYLDEAHATGVFGPNGMGLLSNPDNNTIVLGTFGKGCGSFGAYIACSSLLKDYLINFCTGLIYTTALPPSVLASIQAALELIPSMVAERQHLLDKSQLVKKELDNIGFETGKSASQIICLYLNNNELATSLAQYLEENNIYARAIKPPTVPINSARIRLSLSVSHSDTEIEQLLSILKRWYANK